MYVLIVLFIIFLVLAVLGIFEYRMHQKRIYSIPHRIHINGTRGKSSVTRLIGAGLREGGISAITKVTGTFPRLIMENGKEVIIYRRASANILEQLSIVKYAASRKAQALIIECMALQPQFQWITENQMIHASVGVITNVRMDHIDIMGHTLHHIANTLGKTIPKKQHLFTAENKIVQKMKTLAKKKNSTIHFSHSNSVSKELMKGFSYIEHRENVALALDICEHIGVKRAIALKGMYKAQPDEGALKAFKIKAFGKDITFYNAFAANDPDSSFMIWKKLDEEIGLEGTRMVLLNTRQDRLDRAKQLVEMVGNKIKNNFDLLLLIGQSTDVVENIGLKNGINRDKIINIGWTSPADVFERILSFTQKASNVTAIGNMGGMGADVAAYFEHRSISNND